MDFMQIALEEAHQAAVEGSSVTLHPLALPRGVGFFVESRRAEGAPRRTY